MNFLRRNKRWLALIAVFLALTPLVFRLADLERGFQATGGEIFFPLIPLFLWAFVSTIKNSLRKEDEND